MRIEKGQLIAGYPAVRIRNMFRRLFNVVQEGNVVHLLGVSKTRAKHVLKELVQAGFLKPDPRWKGCYGTTPLSDRLSCASATPLLPREKADRMLEELKIRALEVNRNLDYTWRVSKLVVFGSYLDKSKDKIGDLDVMVELAHKSGHTYGSDDEKTQNDPKAPSVTYWWQKTRVYRALKNRRIGISLHPFETDYGLLKNGPSMEVDLSC